MHRLLSWDLTWSKRMLDKEYTIMQIISQSSSLSLNMNCSILQKIGPSVQYMGWTSRQWKNFLRIPAQYIHTVSYACTAKHSTTSLIIYGAEEEDWETVCITELFVGHSFCSSQVYRLKTTQQASLHSRNIIRKQPQVCTISLSYPQTRIKLNSGIRNKKSFSNKIMLNLGMLTKWYLLEIDFIW